MNFRSERLAKGEVPLMKFMDKVFRAEIHPKEWYHL